MKRQSETRLNHGELAGGVYHACHEALPALLEILGKAVVVTDTCFMIEHGNQPFERMFETWKGCYLGKHLARVINDPSFTVLLDEFLCNPERCQDEKMTLRLKSGNGREEPRFIEIIPYKLAGRGYLLVLDDCTGRRNHITRLRNIIGVLLSELSRPLKYIESHMLTLTSGNETGVAEEVRNSVLRMSEALALLARFDQLHQHAPLKTRTVQVEERVNAALVDLRMKVTERSIQVHFESCDQETFIQADPDLLREMFYQILHNSLKFANVDCKVHVQCTETDDQVLICIADNGRGMTPKGALRAVEPFYQERDVKGMYGGLGLGLTIAHSIAELHGGALRIMGESRKGATVWIGLKRG